MITANHCQQIFDQGILDYHVYDSVDQPINNPYPEGGIDHTLYLKSWVDTVQWHYEDLIRDPNIDPVAGMTLKRKIDKSNQHRTDLVEQIDDYFLAEFASVEFASDARINSESPAWVVDRLSILALKLYHMVEQVERDDVDLAHEQASQEKLTVLQEQKTDLSLSFDELLTDIASGIRKMKVYRQMKLYNDPKTNPVFYKNK